MKVMLRAGSWMAAAALVLVPGLAMASSGSAKVEVREKTMLAGQELAPGTYTVAWTGDAELQVKVSKGKKVVAETRGRFEERSSPASYDSLVVRPNADGRPVLAEIRFGGKKGVLVLAGS